MVEAFYQFLDDINLLIVAKCHDNLHNPLETSSYKRLRFYGISQRINGKKYITTLPTNWAFEQNLKIRVGNGTILDAFVMKNVVTCGKRYSFIALPKFK